MRQLRYYAEFCIIGCAVAKISGKYNNNGERSTVAVFPMKTKLRGREKEWYPFQSKNHVQISFLQVDGL